MLYEVVFVVHRTSVALLSTCQPGSQSRTPRFGPRESHSLGAKAVPLIQHVKRVKPLSTPTLVPRKSSHIMNRFNISSVKRDIIASVCQYAFLQSGKIDDAVRQLSCPSQYCRHRRHLHYRAGKARMCTHRIEAQFCFVMSLMVNSQRPIIQKSMYVVIVFIRRVA